MTIDEEYLDVLQNIEFAIVSVFREHRETNDYNVMRALDAAIGHYNAERRGHEPKAVSLADDDMLIFERIKDTCEFRLGRGQPMGDDMPPIGELTAEEIVACLRKIRKSVDRWNQRGGRQGYLRFVSQFVK